MKAATDEQKGHAFWYDWTTTFRNSCVAARCLGLGTTGDDICSGNQLPFSGGTIRAMVCGGTVGLAIIGR